jgi:hypothetical protein
LNFIQYEFTSEGTDIDFASGVPFLIPNPHNGRRNFIVRKIFAVPVLTVDERSSSWLRVGHTITRDGMTVAVSFEN